MLAARFSRQTGFLARLLPQYLHVEIEQLTSDEAMKPARFLAAMVGQAHARQMDGGSKKQWLNELQQHRTPDIRRPIVALVLRR
jgi:uncharacterized protein (DUF2252 family)